MTATNNTLLHLENLSKSYGKKQVLNQINLSLEGGHIVGLLGPNGSGKTTLMKILSGTMNDYQGNVTIDGSQPGVYTKAVLSYLPDSGYFAPWMTPRDLIRLFKDFYQDFDAKKCTEMLQRLNLDEKQKIKKMSKGMIEKFQLSLVMSRNAKLYVLDEPLGGIDPAARDFILDTILRNYAEDATILIATHLISDVERIFDTVLFLKNGQIVLNENIDHIREQQGKSIDELFREVFKC